MHAFRSQAYTDIADLRLMSQDPGDNDIDVLLSNQQFQEMNFHVRPLGGAFDLSRFCER